ncbi:MAG: L-aspartate oxidase [Bacteroidales bacterium]|jgi:L-aspartate oxidase|nr:L-aspartate oxidase [Bacteroidales bacterium]
MKREVDFLVIGSGLAGLSFALKVAPYGKVCLVSKTGLDETNTCYAQGGIAAVTDESDSYEKHVADTLIAGDGLCTEEVVRMVVREAPEQIQQLIEWGTEFDRTGDGNFDLAREGGHSEHRILHHKDNTGFEIQRALSGMARNHPNIEILENHFAVDVITQHHLGKLVKRYHSDTECYGAYLLDIKKNKTFAMMARVTMMATGGTGNLYSTTTNPIIATGDGIAMVYRAKGIIDNMEFIQFHPTSLYHPGDKPSFLITEAMRGFGAVLRTIDGKEFMHKYDQRRSLAPRDIVARAIDNEMKVRGDDHVYLDATHTSHEGLKSHFPNIYEKCLSIGIDITKDFIPVIPAAHYQCGGIKVDMTGRSSINRLYAAGETTCTGLHGANRLASNSLIEAVVYANNAAMDAIRNFREYQVPDNIPDWNTEGTAHPEEMVLITQNYREMQQIMSNYVGIVRSNLRLKRAMDRLQIIYDETEALYAKTTLSIKLCELRNMINAGYLVIKSAQARRESIGLHYNIDYPHSQPLYQTL